jgi:outer membrane protein OmpA-like peptidoglycan-associated protein
MKRILLLIALLGLVVLSPAGAKTVTKPSGPTLPSYFTVPANFKVAADGGGVLAYEDFGEAEFYQADSDEPIVKQGKHWYGPFELKGVRDDIAGKDAWKPIKAALIAGGWTIPVEYDANPFSAMARYQKDGKDVWAYMKIFGRDDIRLNIVEVGQFVSNLVINPPAATPEKVNAKAGDFPYLPPLPGSTFGTSGPTGSMEVLVPGATEAQLVGNSSITKSYGLVAGLSTVSFVSSYSAALTKAGWTIIEQSAGMHQTDATLTAHYAANGRDIWAYLHMGGEEYTIKVADAGSDNDIARTFAKSCHVALYGVLFDFNKATLKPESDGVLQRVLAFVKKDPALKLEVQGHTDNVGSDDYNQKLSEARAQSVLTWLTQHGIAADRLSFKGYGKTQPVTTNDTDDGRAKNRRVEIARPGCTAKAAR